MGKFYEGLYDELSLFVRHTAWLHAMPERAEGDKSNKPLKSRLTALREADDEYEPEMPPVGGAEHVLAYLWEVGPSVAAGMGAGPITHTEIVAWCELTGIDLEQWEARFLRRLSIEYLNELHKSEKRDAPAPWQVDIPEPIPKWKAQQAAYRALARL